MSHHLKRYSVADPRVQYARAFRWLRLVHQFAPIPGHIAQWETPKGRRADEMRLAVFTLVEYYGEAGSAAARTWLIREVIPDLASPRRPRRKVW